MPESQLHGFAWEDEIKRSAFRMETSVNYTGAHDIPKEFNIFNANENISVKTTGSGTVCMGDALRLFRYSPDEKHTCILVRYKQEADRKVLTSTYELDLDNRPLLWGSVTLEDVVELDALVRSMPSGTRDATIDAEIRRKKKELNALSGMIRFNPKIDSKSQRRLQCSIPNFAESTSLVKVNIADAIVRGIRIAGFVLSGRRIRNRLVQE